MKKASLCALWIFVGGLLACRFQTKVEHKAPRQPWTVILYFGIDNYQFGTFPTDLWGLTDNLVAGMSFLSRPELPILLLYDGRKVGDSCIYELSSRRLINDQGAVIPQDGPSAQEVNYGDPATMTRFIIWAAREYPAQHYLLGLCHHYGWQGYNTDESSPGPLGMDILTLSEHAQAMREVKAAGIKIDVIWFEACSITMLETLYQYGQDADYVVGNEDTIDFFEMAVRLPAMMSWFRKHPAASPEQVARELVNKTPLLTPSLLSNQFLPFQYVSMKKSPGGKASLSRLGVSWQPTQFAFKGSAVNEVAQAVDHLARLLLADLPRFRPAVEKARGKAKEYSLSPWYVDLYDFARLLAEAAPDPEITTATTDLKNAVHKTILVKKLLPADQRHHGILILFPLTPAEWENEKVNRFAPHNRYADLAFAQNTAWDEFLEEFFRNQKAK